MIGSQFLSVIPAPLANADWVLWSFPQEGAFGGSMRGESAQPARWEVWLQGASGTASASLGPADPHAGPVGQPSESAALGPVITHKAHSTDTILLQGSSPAKQSTELPTSPLSSRLFPVVFPRLVAHGSRLALSSVSPGVLRM